MVPHPNRVALFYPKDGSRDAQGRARIGPKDLLESALRMRPDRILLQELRDGSAFYYLRNVNSGHPGSITTIHANSCALAFEQLTLLVKESDGGRDLTRADIRELVHATVDVVVQCQRVGGAFKVVEVALTQNGCWLTRPHHRPHRHITLPHHIPTTSVPCSTNACPEIVPRPDTSTPASGPAAVTQRAATAWRSACA